MSDVSKKSISCPLAFHQLEVDTDGKVRPCCNFSGAYGTLHNTSLTDLFQSEGAQSLRKNLNNGVKDPSCNHCWKLEDLNIISKRQQALTIFDHYQISTTKLTVEPNAPTGTRLASLDLKQSNICNLKCRTCSPFASSKWYEEFISGHREQFGNEDLTQDENLKQAQVRWFDSQFWLKNKDLLESVEKIDFYGGEPLADPYHHDFLKYLIETQQSQNLSLVYGSNGVLVTEKEIKLWANFKRVKLQLSQDGIGPAFEYLRHPAKWERYLKTIELLKTTQLQTGGCRSDGAFQFGVTVTFGSLNIMHLPETLNWLHENNIEFATNPIVHPPRHSCMNLPESIKRSVIEKFQRISNYKPWMKPWLAEAISFMQQSKSDQAAFEDLVKLTQHGDKWRHQALKYSLRLTAKLFKECGYENFETTQNHLSSDSSNPNRLLSPSPNVSPVVR